jgi:hypothetical protein
VVGKEYKWVCVNGHEHLSLRAGEVHVLKDNVLVVLKVKKGHYTSGGEVGLQVFDLVERNPMTTA